MQQINGMGFMFNIGGLMISALKMSLDITDNTAAVKRGGRPGGWVQGDVEASGTITVDRPALRAICSIGVSFQDIPPINISTVGQAGGDWIKIDAYGCKLKLGKLMDVDTNSSEETTFEIPYVVTSPNFVEIDNKPYCSYFL